MKAKRSFFMIKFDPYSKELSFDTIFIAQNSGTVDVEISKLTYDANVQYFVEIACPQKKKFVSKPLEFKNNIFCCTLSNATIQSVGDYFLQLVAKSTTGETATKSLVSDLPFLVVKESINAVNTILDDIPDGFVNGVFSSVVQMQSLKQEVETKLQNGEFVGAKGDKGEPGAKGDKGDTGNLPCNVLQTSGQSEVDLMSQKAVTSCINSIALVPSTNIISNIFGSSIVGGTKLYYNVPANGWVFVSLADNTTLASLYVAGKIECGFQKNALGATTAYIPALKGDVAIVLGDKSGNFKFSNFIYAKEV